MLFIRIHHTNCSNSCWQIARNYKDAAIFVSPWRNFYRIVNRSFISSRLTITHLHSIRNLRSIWELLEMQFGLSILFARSRMFAVVSCRCISQRRLRTAIHIYRATCIYNSRRVRDIKATSFVTKFWCRKIDVDKQKDEKQLQYFLYNTVLQNVPQLCSFI